MEDLIITHANLNNIAHAEGTGVELKPKAQSQPMS